MEWIDKVDYHDVKIIDIFDEVDSHSTKEFIESNMVDDPTFEKILVEADNQPIEIPSCKTFTDTFSIKIKDVYFEQKSISYWKLYWLKDTKNYSEFKVNLVVKYNHFIGKIGHKLNTIYKTYFKHIVPYGTIILEWKHTFGDHNYLTEFCPLNEKTYNQIVKGYKEEALKWYNENYIPEYRKELQEWWFNKHQEYIKKHPESTRLNNTDIVDEDKSNWKNLITI
jgi:hypothetical protein